MSTEPPTKKQRSSKVEVSYDDMEVKFHHVQFYVDQVKSLDEYKKLENAVNKLANKGSFDPFSGGMRFLEAAALPHRVKEGKDAWDGIAKELGIDSKDESDFTSGGQDIIEQLIIGLGWRVTAVYDSCQSKSVLVSSQDPQGVKVVVTAKAGEQNGTSNGTASNVTYDHFKAEKVTDFMKNRAGRQGIAVLGFEVANGTLDQILKNYKEKHPKLVIQDSIYSYIDKRVVQTSDCAKEVILGEMRVLDVTAYYTGEVDSDADHGTVLRFVERSGSYASTPGFANPQGVLPGLEDVPATYDGTSIPAYSDHWVSNVVSRVGFLKTLEDTLGFTPKVDFNAGVVAAGEAQIESTVTGNESKYLSKSEEEVLRNQTQVYLPINNALSEVGHVHGFLKEIGQGVQHLASRVSDLVAFIERVNNYRKITGRGFSFLRIPRSYYGRFDVKQLVAGGISEALAKEIEEQLESSNLMSAAGIVDLDITDDQIKGLKVKTTAEFEEKLATIQQVVKRARYVNLYSLLREHLGEASYLKVVRNQILVDIQGEDILYQIFTCNVVQREVGQEAPFLEFIERVCSECNNKKEGEACAPIKPGCGGFGIRNFLTLFLSIEVSKAMDEFDSAKASGDEKTMERARKMITAFTEQLELSNPILTSISDAMTSEGLERELAEKCKDDAEKQKHLQKATEFCAAKEAGNVALKELSLKYKNIMKEIKQSA